MSTTPIDELEKYAKGTDSACIYKLRAGIVARNIHIETFQTRIVMLGIAARTALTLLSLSDVERAYQTEARSVLGNIEAFEKDAIPEETGDGPKVAILTKQEHEDLVKERDELKLQLSTKKSRLDEECIMAVVRNRSGIDAGEIDYDLMCAKFDRQDLGSLKDIKETLGVLVQKTEGRILELMNALPDEKKEKE